MFTIQKATTNDIQLINEMAQIVFPATYREILSKEQLDLHDGLDVLSEKPA